MLESIIRDLRRIFHGFDDGALRVVLATFIANKIEQRPTVEADNDLVIEQIDPLSPVWLLLVGPPSSLKTESINLISGHRETHELVELTTKTIASGHSGADHLLIEMTDKIVLMKDLSSIFSKRDFEIGAILDQLRQIYDGRVSFSWGSGKETFNWNGKVGLIAGCTEDIYERYKVVGEMGDRFLYYPVRTFTDTVNRQAVSRAARRNSRRDGTMRRALRDRTHFLIDRIMEDTIYEDAVAISDEMGEVIDMIADLATRMRGYVPRDYRHNIVAPPQLEGPGRMAKTLELMAIALAVVHQVPEPTWAHLALLRKVAFGGTKPVRRSVILALANRARVDPRVTTSLADLTRLVGKPRTTVERAADDLEALGVLRSFKQGNLRVYELVYDVRDTLLRVLALGADGGCGGDGPGEAGEPNAR